ncbi:unnamed protein product [Closterium sp. Naga37s-1]|nr:unnamed protein product [Closterium sp. Naga37s-1]
MGAFPHTRLHLLAACKATSSATIAKCSASAAAAARSSFVSTAPSRASSYPIAPPLRPRISPLLRLRRPPMRPPVRPPCASPPVPTLYAREGGHYKGEEVGKGPTVVGALDSAIPLPALFSAAPCNGGRLGRGVQPSPLEPPAHPLSSSSSLQQQLLGMPRWKGGGGGEEEGVGVAGMARQPPPPSSNFCCISHLLLLLLLVTWLQREVSATLRRVLEVPIVHMSSRQWEHVAYRCVPFVCMKNIRNLLFAYDEARFEKYLEDVKAGTAKITAGALLPHEVVKAAIEAAEDINDSVGELQWKAMMADVQGETLV